MSAGAAQLLGLREQPGPVHAGREAYRPVSPCDGASAARDLPQVARPRSHLRDRGGDGTRTLIGGAPRQGSPPAKRVALRFEHVFRAVGTATVTARAITTSSCRNEAMTASGVTTTFRVFPKRVRVQKVVGLRPLQAKCALERHGLRWRFRGASWSPSVNSCESQSGPAIFVESSEVVFQRPRAGRSVRPGTVVLIDDCNARYCIYPSERGSGLAGPVSSPSTGARAA